MKLSHLALLLLAVLTFSLASCKEDETPKTPVQELLIGKWQTFELKENGNSLPASEGYKEIIFTIDSSEEKIISIAEFEEDGAEVSSLEDTWELIDSDATIAIEGETDLDIRKITNDSLIVYFQKNDPFSGNDVEHEDSYIKIE